MTTLAEEPFAILAQVRAISEQWVGDKGLPEMGFTLGGVDEALDPAVKVGLAIDTTAASRGDLVAAGVRRGRPGPGMDPRRDAPPRRRLPVRHGVHDRVGLPDLPAGRRAFVSLSGAPLARSEEAGESWRRDRLLDQLGASLEPVYGFRSLHAFKAKFAPRYEPIYLAFRDEATSPASAWLSPGPTCPTRPLARLLAAGLSAHGEQADAGAR